MHPQLTPKQIKKLKRQGKLRDGIEIWVDQQNPKLELLRTLAGLVAAICSALVFMKVFKVF